VIAPGTIEALGDGARALGFQLIERDDVKSIGVDAEQIGTPRTWYAIEHPLVGTVFEGTSRECSAFLIGYRDCHAEYADVTTDVTASSCAAVDAEGRQCIQPAKHTNPHAALIRW
jgi:hypothetical protein